METTVSYSGQELQDDSLLRSQENHSVVLIRPRSSVHRDFGEAVPEMIGSPFLSLRWSVIKVSPSLLQTVVTLLSSNNLKGNTCIYIMLSSCSGVLFPYAEC